MSDKPPPELKTIELLQLPENFQILTLAEKCLQLEASHRISAKNITTHFFNLE